MRLNDDRHLSLTFHYRSSQNKINTGRDATYNVVETVIHPIKVERLGGKELLPQLHSGIQRRCSNEIGDLGNTRITRLVPEHKPLLNTHLALHPTGKRRSLPELERLHWDVLIPSQRSLNHRTVSEG